MYPPITFAVGLCTTVLFLSSYAAAVAQVIEDGTAGTIVNGVGTYTITGGTQEITTLFHSFEDFSPGTVPVFFELDGAHNDVNLVLGRVTGNNASFIDSELGLSGGNVPDLFLINPNGVSFGADARLDIPGSFMVSTADSVLFPDGQSFSSDLSMPPPLTISTPIGLQFGVTAAPITVEGSILDLSTGKSLGFFGGDVRLRGANASAAGGRFFVGSVAAGSLIAFVDSTFLADYANVTNFQDITLDQNTQVDLRGDGSGRIQLRGDSVSLTQRASLAAYNTGDGQGEDFTITANTLTAEDASLFTNVSNDNGGRAGNMILQADTINLNDVIAHTGSSAGGSAQGGDLIIIADALIVDEGFFSTEPFFSDGNSGDITLQAETIQLGNYAIFTTNADGLGQGGDITITTDVLSVDNARILAISSSVGNAGDLTINAGTINLQNTAAVVTDTYVAGQGGNLTINADVLTADKGLILSSTRTEKAAGTMTLNVGTLDLRNGTRLVTDTSGAGRGGDLTINANVLTADDALMSASALDTGDAGTMTLNVGTLDLQNETQILANTSGAGQGGDLAIVANTFSTDSASVSTSTFDEGDAGTLTIQADSFDLANQTFVTAESDGTGQGGDLTIAAEVLTASNSLISTGTADGGNGGNLAVEVDTLDLQNRAVISTITIGTSQGGDLTVTANRVTADNSLLTTNTFNGGDAGDILLQVGALELKNTSQVASATFSEGNGGDLQVMATDVVNITGYRSDESTTVSGLFASTTAESTGTAGDIYIATPVLNLDDGGAVATNTVGAGAAGNIAIRATEITVAESLSSRSGGVSGIVALVSSEASGPGGSIDIESDRLRVSDGGQIAAYTLGSGDAGTIGIRANEISVVGASSTQLLPSAIAIGSVENVESPFELKGNGGSITLEANQLNILDGGQITALTETTGDAGAISIQADTLNLAGTANQLSLPSTITASSLTSATAGSISVEGDGISIQNGAEISVNSDGNAGNINLSSGTIYLNSGIVSGNVGIGTGGNLNLSARGLLLMRNGSLISTNAQNTATGGNILLDALTIVGIENSDITANAIFGSGGNISLTTGALVGLQFREQQTPQNDITASSQFGISGNVEVDSFNTDPVSDLTDLPKNLLDIQNQIVQHCDAQGGSFSITGRGGLPAPPGQSLTLDVLWHDMRPLEEAANIRTLSLPSMTEPLEQEKLVEASTWRITAAGQVEFTTISAAHTNLHAHTTCSSPT